MNLYRKKKISKNLKVSAISIALTSILYGSANATTQESNEESSAQLNLRTFQSFAPPARAQSHINYDSTDQSLVNELHKLSVKDLILKRRMAVQEFSTVVYNTMVNNNTAQMYLNNQHLNYSSTFPLRLYNKFKASPWRPGPFMPIEDKDIGCYFGIPSYRTPLKYDPNTTPVQISANEVEGDLVNGVTYKGNVVIAQADHSLKADEARFDRPNGVLSSSGNLNYSSPVITVTSHGYITSDLKNKTTEFKEPSFQLNGSVLRGSSSYISLDSQNKESNIKDLSFSTCPIGDNSWYVLSKNVDLDLEQEQGYASDTMLYVKDVPVLYLPYVSFPLSNKRKTGFLYPSASISSNHGLDFSQPFYVNIAPNYDYTFTPRIMTKRGILLQNEFRYMPFENTLGTINFDFLPNDRLWSNDEHNYRYFYKIDQRSSFFNEDLVFDLNYQGVRKNDFEYINDLSPSDTAVTDDHLLRSFLITYDRPTWNMSLEARDYQKLLPSDINYARLFALLPQLKAQYYNTVDSFTFDISTEMTRFSSTDDDLSRHFEASRIHFEPAIDYQLFNSRGSNLNVGLRGFFTHYDQDSLDRMPKYYQENLGFTHLDSSVNRALYLAEIRGKSTFERKVLDLRHTQTIEPEIQYQYIPYKNQDNIANYDTTDRMNDYYSNFSFRHFTGNDRIVDLNRLTVGLSSRLLDPHDHELLRVGVSQSFLFTPIKTTLTPIDQVTKDTRSPLAFYINAQPIPEITTHASISYSTSDSQIDSWSAMTEYKNENGLMVQVSYRFAHDGNRTLSNNIVNLSQLGLLAQVPIGDKLTFTMASYRDLEQSQNIDSKFALSYEDCCWSVSLIYENFNKTEWRDLSRQHEQRIGVQFELKGIGAVNVTGHTDKNFTDTHLLNKFNPTNLSR